MTKVKEINIVSEVIEQAVREAAKKAMCEEAMCEEENIYNEIPSSAEYAELQKYFHFWVEVETDEFGHPTVAGDQALKDAMARYVPMIWVKWYYPLPGMRIGLTSSSNPFLKWNAYHGTWYDIKNIPDLEREYYEKYYKGWRLVGD